MTFVQRAAEQLARRTSRSGFFGKGADVAFGALIGAAAGTALDPRAARAQHTPTHTVCAFPSQPCACDRCVRPDGVATNGVCGKPCVIWTRIYANGCWVMTRNDDGTQVTCCDCDCQGENGVNLCGCGSDHHNHPEICPDVAA